MIRRTLSKGLCGDSEGFWVSGNIICNKREGKCYSVSCSSDLSAIIVIICPSVFLPAELNQQECWYYFGARV